MVAKSCSCCIAVPLLSACFEIPSIVYSKMQSCSASTRLIMLCHCAIPHPLFTSNDSLTTLAFTKQHCLPSQICSSPLPTHRHHGQLPLPHFNTGRKRGPKKHTYGTAEAKVQRRWRHQCIPVETRMPSSGAIFPRAFSQASPTQSSSRDSRLDLRLCPSQDCPEKRHTGRSSGHDIGERTVRGSTAHPFTTA